MIPDAVGVVVADGGLRGVGLGVGEGGVIVVVVAREPQGVSVA